VEDALTQLAQIDGVRSVNAAGVDLRRVLVASGGH